MKGNVIWYIFVLIAIFLIVVYYKGSSSVGGTLFSGVNKLALTLQGRNQNGAITSYPGNTAG